MQVDGNAREQRSTSDKRCSPVNQQKQSLDMDFGTRCHLGKTFSEEEIRGLITVEGQ